MLADEVTTVQLLGAYLSGDVTADERAAVEKYLSEEPSARCHLSALQELTELLKAGDKHARDEALDNLRRTVGKLVQDHRIYAALAAGMAGEATEQERELARAHFKAQPQARVELRSLTALNHLIKQNGDRVSNDALSAQLRARINAALPAVATAAHSNGGVRQARASSAVASSDSGRLRPSLRIYAVREYPWKKRVLALSGLAALLALWAGVGALRRNLSPQPDVAKGPQELLSPDTTNPVETNRIPREITGIAPGSEKNVDNRVKPQTPPAPLEEIAQPGNGAPVQAPPVVTHSLATGQTPEKRAPVMPRAENSARDLITPPAPENPTVVQQNSAPKSAQKPVPNLLNGIDDATTQVVRNSTPPVPATGGVPQKSIGSPTTLPTAQFTPNVSSTGTQGTVASAPPVNNGPVTPTTNAFQGASVNPTAPTITGSATVGAIKGAGVAQMTLNGKTTSLKKDAAVPSGATIETSDNVHVALQLPGGGKLYVNSNSNLILDLTGKVVSINLAAGEVYVTTASGGGSVSLNASKIRVDQAVEADVAIAGQVRAANLGAKALKLTSSGAKAQSANVETGLQASVSPDGSDAIKKDAIAAQTGYWRQDVLLDGDGLKAINAGARSRR